MLITCAFALSGPAAHAQKESPNLDAPIRKMKWNIDLQIMRPDQETESYSLFDDGKMLHFVSGAIAGHRSWSGITSSENANTIYSNVCELSPGHSCKLGSNTPVSTGWLATAVCIQVKVSVGEQTASYEECVKEMANLSPQLLAVVHSLENIVPVNQKITEREAE